mgnify:CR=1 FL=1
MSETQVEQETSTEQSNSTAGDVKLNGIFAHKVGMSSVYTEAGQSIPVTVLKLGSWKVTQVKTVEKDGYNAIQITSFGRRLELRGRDLRHLSTRELSPCDVQPAEQQCAYQDAAEQEP